MSILSERTETDLQVDKVVEELKAREEPINFSEERINEIFEFHKRYHPIEHAPQFFARQIKGLDEWKILVGLATISAPKPFHIISIGDPACGKSEVAQAFDEITPNTTYRWGSKLSRAGLTVAKVGRHIHIGALPRSHWGQCFLDEFNLLPRTEASALLASMQHGWFSVEKANIKGDYIPAKCSITGMANPRGDYFRSTHPSVIEKQIPFSSKALLTRFHAIHLILRPSVAEFKELSEHQIKSKLRKIDNVFQTDDEIKIWGDYVEFARRINVDRWNRLERYTHMISAFTTEAYRQASKTRSALAIPISPRINEGLMNLSECYARASLRTTVTQNDVAHAITIIAKSLKMCGLDTQLAYKAVIKAIPEVKEMPNLQELKEGGS